MTDETPHNEESGPSHPEEMKASVNLRIGNSIAITATARATPAGLVAAALLIAAIVIPLVWLTKDPARTRLRSG